MVVVSVKKGEEEMNLASRRKFSTAGGKKETEGEQGLGRKIQGRKRCSQM